VFKKKIAKMHARWAVDASDLVPDEKIDNRFHGQIVLGPARHPGWLFVTSRGLRFYTEDFRGRVSAPWQQLSLRSGGTTR
jgi:hypothetical protein